MRGIMLVPALAAMITVAMAREAVAQDSPDRVVAIQDAPLGEGNAGGSDEAKPVQVRRGQLLTAYTRDGNRVYVVFDSAGGGRQRNWGWLDAASVLPPAKAAAHFSDCLKKNPKDAGAYLGRASAESALGQNDRVIADCGELLRLDPKSTAGYYLRGSVWQTLGKNDKAIADFGEVVRLDPKRADAYRLRGDLWRKQKNYAEAIADYTRLLKMAPNQIDAYYSRALARYEMKDYRKALDDLNEILGMQPEMSAAYKIRGLVWERLLEFDKAEDDFTDALNMQRTQGLPWRAQFWNLLQQGDYVNARYYAVEFLRMQDLCAEDLAELAECHAMQGQLDRALDECDEALRIDPSSVHAHHLRGLYRVEKKQFALAMADFDKALRLDPKFAILHRVARGGCRADLGQFDLAAADLEEAVRMDPDNEHTLNALAWFLATCDDARHRDGKRAVMLATKACQADEWDSSGIIDTLAATYAEAGDFAQAIRWQQKAVDTATPGSKKEMTERLALYMAHKPYREPLKQDASPVAAVSRAGK